MNGTKSAYMRRGLAVAFSLLSVIALSGVALASGGGGEAAHGLTPVPWNDMIEAFVNFTIFAGLLYYFAKKPVNDYLVSRSQSISSQLDEAAKLRKEAEEMLAEFRDKLQRIGDERRSIVEGYLRQAEKERREILENAREVASRLKADAGVTIAYEIKQAQTDLRERIVDEAVQIAREIIEKRLDQKSREKLVDEYTEALAQTKDRATL